MELRQKFFDILNTIKIFCNKHTEGLTIFGLAVVFYFIFFHGIGTYSLMDVDETRYVAMSRDMFLSKDFLTLYLNGEYFFEKPPLYFWQECLSFFIFGGKINEFTARFPVALLGFMFSFIVYFTSRKRINRRFGVFSSLILATSLEFIMLSKYAILDIVLTFYIGLALVCYFQVYFCREQSKKFYWWAFYIFSGLAVMAKGIPGFIIPFGTVFFTSIMAKRFKEIFKPIFIIPGVILFSLIVLPWHILMLKLHNPLFFNEYIMKHHIHRFFNVSNDDIGRKQPFYYYFLVVLWGLIPWVFSMIAVFVEKLKNLEKQHYFEKIRNFDFYSLDNVHKQLALCWVCVIFIMLFFSASSTKLVTYILPIYYPLSLILGLMWKDYADKKLHEKSINLSVKVFGWFCVVFGVAAMFTPYFLPMQLEDDIAEMRWFALICVLIFGIGTLLLVRYKKYLGVFVFYVLFMTVVSAFITEELYEVDYRFGQQELVHYARYAKQNDLTISTFGLTHKYSLLFYNDERVDYNEDMDQNKNIVSDIKKDLKRENNVVIIRNKDMNYLKNVNYQIIEKGRRYSMIKGK
ncbi:MAG: glycosyltransferase family 39 protein [Muribaculaceae bacterium]|nr:glycosyltransferase family 39 protein [Muribaculaceae bacterium]